MLTRTVNVDMLAQPFGNQWGCILDILEGEVRTTPPDATELFAAVVRAYEYFELCLDHNHGWYLLCRPRVPGVPRDLRHSLRGSLTKHGPTTSTDALVRLEAAIDAAQAAVHALGVPSGCRVVLRGAYHEGVSFDRAVTEYLTSPEGNRRRKVEAMTAAINIRRVQFTIEPD